MPSSERRLAHIHLGHDGGSERFLVRLAGGLAARGFEQIAFVRPDRPWRDALAAHCTVKELRFSRHFPKRQIARFRVGRAIDRFGASAALAWMNHSARWLPAPRPGLRTFARLGDVPLSLDSHKYYTQKIIGNTPEIVAKCIALGWPAEHVHMISNFVDEDRSAPVDRRTLDTPADAIVVAALGRFVPRKGFDLLIEALARTDGIHLWLIGDGPEAETLKAQITRLGLWDRVRLPGWQPSGMPFIKAADILCCPSREEPLGNVVLEGWAAGRPVVATASEGPKWLIENERTGLLTPIDAVDPLAVALARLRDDAALRSRLAESATAELHARFSEEAICRAYVDLLTGPSSTSRSTHESGVRRPLEQAWR